MNKSGLKIVMTTIPFWPKHGGMETVVTLLAQELVLLGCEIKVVTQTPSDKEDLLPYEVIRRPSLRQLLRLYLWSDAYLQHGPSLTFGWPALLKLRPAVIVHHIWMNESYRPAVLAKWIRLALLKSCQNLSVSKSLGESLSVPYALAPNPYDDKLFCRDTNITPDRDLIFLGRLEPNKGIPDLIDALALLKKRSFSVNLTIVGGGSMEKESKAKVQSLDLTDSITFAGRVPGPDLAPLLARHKIMVVPSRYNEPFGVVALEGIACGCVVIGSSGGGLPEAIGPCGITFANGNPTELAEKIEQLLRQPDLLEAYRQKSKAHLSLHRPEPVAKEYLRLLRMHFDL